MSSDDRKNFRLLPAVERVLNLPDVVRICAQYGRTTVTNWVRDKGFGMGSKVGAIPSAVGGIEIQLSHVGTVFPATGENLARFVMERVQTALGSMQVVSVQIDEDDSLSAQVNRE